MQGAGGKALVQTWQGLCQLCQDTMWTRRQLRGLVFPAPSVPRTHTYPEHRKLPRALATAAWRLHQAPPSSQASPGILHCVTPTRHLPATPEPWRGSQCLPLINRSGLVPGKVHIACAKCPKTVASRVENLGPMMYFLSPAADRTERSLLACPAPHGHRAFSTLALYAYLTVNQKFCRVKMHAPPFS